LGYFIFFIHCFFISKNNYKKTYKRECPCELSLARVARSHLVIVTRVLDLLDADGAHLDGCLDQLAKGAVLLCDEEPVLVDELVGPHQRDKRGHVALELSHGVGGVGVEQDLAQLVVDVLGRHLDLGRAHGVLARGRGDELEQRCVGRVKVLDRRLGLLPQVCVHANLKVVPAFWAGLVAAAN